jgi:hypothetical protein
MEVHHGHSSGPKGLKEYFLEFFMLFIAVTLGFFAENLREHYVEKQREKQYLHKLSADLRQDTAKLNFSIAFKIRKSRQADSLISLITAHDYDQHLPLIYYYARLFFVREPFYATEGTIRQLLNAGGLRLIEKDQIIEKINQYQAAKEKIFALQALEDENAIELRKLTYRIFDAGPFSHMVDVDQNKGYRYYIKPPDDPKPLLSHSPDVINEYCNWVGGLNSTQSMNRELMIRLKENAVALITLIEQNQD